MRIAECGMRIGKKRPNELDRGEGNMALMGCSKAFQGETLEQVQ